MIGLTSHSYLEVPLSIDQTLQYCTRDTEVCHSCPWTPTEHLELDSLVDEPDRLVGELV